MTEQEIDDLILLLQGGVSDDELERIRFAAFDELASMPTVTSWQERNLTPRKITYYWADPPLFDPRGDTKLGAWFCVVRTGCCALACGSQGDSGPWFL